MQAMVVVSFSVKRGPSVGCHAPKHHGETLQKQSSVVVCATKVWGFTFCFGLPAKQVACETSRGRYAGNLRSSGQLKQRAQPAESSLLCA